MLHEEVSSSLTDCKHSSLWKRALVCNGSTGSSLSGLVVDDRDGALRDGRGGRMRSWQVAQEVCHDG
jgi:hypothetical protein